MSNKDTNIIEDALLDFKKIDEAIKANTKEILRSVMKEEIEGYTKESLSDEDEDENDYEESDIDPETEIAGSDEDGVEGGEADDELGIDADGGDEPEISDELPAELDMTSSSDEDVIAVYKKMSGSDEIEIVSDNEVKITEPTTGAEYVIKLGGKGGSVTELPAVADDSAEDGIEGGETEDGLSDELGIDTDTETDGDSEGFGDEEDEDELGESIMYEIEMDDEDEDEINENGVEHLNVKTVTDSGTKDNTGTGFKTVKVKKAESDDYVMDESEDNEIDEKIQVGKGLRVSNNKTTIAGAGADKKVNEDYKAKYEALVKENEIFKEALKTFRSKLTETVVFNSNLTHVVRLFTEHTTTKNEKKSIIERFDRDATSLKESKRLYKTIADELSSIKTVAESVESKINKEVASGKTVIKESVLYADPSAQRILDLMNKLEK